MKKLVYSLFAIAVLLSCKNDPTSNQNETAAIAPVVFDGISPSIKPGDDFFNHVNKTWYDNAVIAEDQIGVGAYRFLNIPQQELLQNILSN